MSRDLRHVEFAVFNLIKGIEGRYFAVLRIIHQNVANIFRVVRRNHIAGKEACPALLFHLIDEFDRRVLVIVSVGFEQVRQRLHQPLICLLGAVIDHHLPAQIHTFLFLIRHHIHADRYSFVKRHSLYGCRIDGIIHDRCELLDFLNRNHAYCSCFTLCLFVGILTACK